MAFFEVHYLRFRAFNVGLVWTTDKGTVRFLVNENKNLGEPKMKKEFS